MPINKQKLKHELFSDKNGRCLSNQNVASELSATLSDTGALVNSCVNAQAIPFIFWNDFYNSSGTLSPKSKKSQYRYKWGDKVFVDFGCANIQTEISFPHPAIVLYNFANSVVVVPTTSDDSPNSFSSDIEDVVIKVQKDGNIFPKDTVINLHQIKTVHKERIISNLHCNVRSYVVDNVEISRQNAIHGQGTFASGMDLLACIRTKIAYIFAEPQMQAKDAEIVRQNEQIEKLRSALAEADKKARELSNHLEKILNGESAQGD